MIIRAGAAVVLLASFPVLAQEATTCKPIYFARGTSSATVSCTAGSDEPFPCYTLATGNGQTATFKFIKTNGNMAFTIDGIIDDRDAYSFKTVAKTYKFLVFQTLRSAPGPFSLMISVR